MGSHYNEPVDNNFLPLTGSLTTREQIGSHAASNQYTAACRLDTPCYWGIYAWRQQLYLSAFSSLFHVLPNMFNFFFVCWLSAWLVVCLAYQNLPDCYVMQSPVTSKLRRNVAEGASAAQWTTHVLLEYFWMERRKKRWEGGGHDRY